MAVVPDVIVPFSPRVQAYTWLLFLFLLAATLNRSHVNAWIKMLAYLNAIVKVEDAPSSANSANSANSTNATSARFVWIYNLYAYAHAYVRIILITILVASASIFMRYLIAVMPQKHWFMAMIARALYAVFDTRAALEFMHYRHWRYHVAGFAVYTLIALTLSVVRFANDDAVKTQEEVSRDYARTATASGFALFAFYVAYAARMIQVSGEA
jgi:hypothetical protein